MNIYKKYKNSGATQELNIADEDYKDDVLCQQPDIRFKYSYVDKWVESTGIATDDDFNSEARLPAFGVTLKLDSFKTES